MTLLSRLLRHLRTTSAAGRRAFPAATLQHITTLIRQGEQQHRAEIRVVIEAALNLREVMQKKTARARARELFSQYRMWDTEENCGVLIYINLADRQVEIIADRSVDRALAAADWHRLCRIMTAGFAQDQFHASVSAALQALNQELAQQFPSNGTHSDQLPDAPLML